MLMEVSGEFASGGSTSLFAIRPSELTYVAISLSFWDFESDLFF